MTSQPRILLTGATGYIGGTVLTHLVASDEPSIKNATITCLVRGEDRVDKLSKAYGSRVNPVLYKDLDDTKRTIEVTSEHDIVINTTLGFHPDSSAALVHGLAKRKEKTGNNVYMIHTSGTSNLADLPISCLYVDQDGGRTFNDATDDIYGYEKQRNETTPYGQRTSELGVIDAGLELGVGTLVIMSPTIYGRGTGHFNQTSIQVPTFAGATLAQGHGTIPGEGKGEWDNVHVEDLAELYKVVLLNVLDKGGKDVPSGKKGIIFSGSRRHHWIDIAQGVAEAAHEKGLIDTPEVESITLTKGVEVYSRDNELRVELSLASNSKTESAVAKKLGWKPTRGDKEWKQGFAEEVDVAAAKRK